MPSLVTIALVSLFSQTPRNQLGPLHLQIPGEWNLVERTDESARFMFPGDVGYVIIDFAPVETTGESAAACRDRIVASMRDANRWEKEVLGKYPSAHNVNGEYAPDISQYRRDFSQPEVRDGNSNYEKVIRTARYLGCDGRFSWSITAVSVTASSEQFYVAQSVERVVKSLRVAPPATPPKR